MSDALAAPTIITPHALPMFRDGEIARGTKRKREKDRMDPRKSKRPELPVTGPGRGGRVGASATQHVVQNLVRDTTRDEDVSAPCPFRPANLHSRPFTSSPSESICWHRARMMAEVLYLVLAVVPAVLDGRERRKATFDISLVRGLAVATETRRYHALAAAASHVCFSSMTITDYAFVAALSSQPREALLRLAATADQDPVWTAGESCFPGGGHKLLVGSALFVFCFVYDRLWC